MEYPRELKLSQKIEEKLKSYLDNELQIHRGERSKWVDDLKRWQEDYWATPSQKEATFPFKGAANTIIPLTAIATEAVHAREMTTLFALEQFVHCKINSPEIQDAQRDLERTIDYELLKGCDIFKFCDTALLENKKLGSCIGKVGYAKIIKTAIVEGPDGQEKDVDIITYQGPTLDVVPLANFLMPFTAVDPQISPWCGEEHLDNQYAVEQKAISGEFRKDTVKDLDNYWAQQQGNLSSTPYTDSVKHQQDQQPAQWSKQVGWHEIWLSFDVDSDPDLDLPPKNREIVVHYHWQSRKFFSIRYNWHTDLHRPYRIGRYFPMEHRWAGIGIGKQNEQFQEMVTTVQRQRLDNATLANMRMFKAKQGSGIGPNEPMFPGRIFLLDDINDLEAIVGGSEVYPSGYNDEQQLIIYSQQRTGVNELNLGMPQVGTPGTATGDITRVQESSRKFDYTFKNSKRFLDEIILDVLCVQSQFGFRDSRYIDMLGTNAPIVKQLLQVDPNDLRSQLYFEVKVIGQNSSTALDRNNWMQFSQILQQYYMEMIQLATQTGNPQIIAAVTGQAMKAGTEAMKQIAEGFDLRGPEKLLLPQQLIDALIGGMQSGPPQLQSGAGGNQTTPTPSQGAPVANTPSPAG